MRHRVSSAALIVVICAADVAACGSVTPTQAPRPSQEAIWTLPSRAPDDSCADAIGGGQLAADTVSGIGFLGLTGQPVHVYWPFGYYALMDGDRLALVDADDQIVAHVGDFVRMAGGYGLRDETFSACPLPIEVVNTLPP